MVRLPVGDTRLFTDTVPAHHRACAARISCCAPPPGVVLSSRSLCFPPPPPPCSHSPWRQVQSWVTDLYFCYSPTSRIKKKNEEQKGAVAPSRCREALSSSLLWTPVHYKNENTSWSVLCWRAREVEATPSISSRLQPIKEEMLGVTNIQLRYPPMMLLTD